MDERLSKEIETHSFVQSKNKKDQEDHLPSDVLSNENKKQDEPFGFFRSQRSVAMRINDTYENQINGLESDKLTLIQRLNDSLVLLDKLNQEKTQLSNQLIEQFKFVRDLQRETQKCDDISGVVDEDLKDDLKREKERNFQLKEELKKHEIERIRILQRMKELQHEVEQNQLQAAEINQSHRIKSEHVKALELDYRDVIMKVESSQNAVDNLRVEIIEMQDNMRVLQERVKAELQERMDNNERYRNLQERYDDIMYKGQRERQDIDLRQNRSQKIISSKIMCLTLESIFNSKLKEVYQKIRNYYKKENKLRKGIYILRKKLEDNTKQRLEKSFLKWYYILNPCKNIKQKKLVTQVLSRKNPLAITFFKWKNIFTQLQSQKLSRHQKLVSLLISTQNYQSRVLRYEFSRWKNIIKSKIFQKSIILSKIINKTNTQLQRAFAKWKNYKLNIDFQIKMNILSQQWGKLRYLSSLFNSWRNVILQLKTKKQSLVIRTWKNLKANVLINKQMRAQTTAILREERVRKQSLMKACLDAMKQNKEQEKLIKVIQQVNETEQPKIQIALEQINQTQQVNNQKNKNQAIFALAKCFGKQIYWYFQKWKNETEKTQVMINSNLKQLVIKSYKLKIRDAFTKWISFKGEYLQKQQQIVIQNNEEDLKNITNIIIEAKQDVQERKQRQQCQSSKQIKKIVQNIYLRQLSQKFNQWKNNINQRNQIENATTILTQKFNRRLKKLAFNKYMQGIKEIQKQELYNRRINEIKFKLREREKKRIFHAIKIFSLNHQKAKSYMQRLIIRLDNGKVQSCFKTWQRFNQYRLGKQLFNKQDSVVQNIKQLIEEEGKLGDQVENINQGNKKLENKIEQLSKRVISKWFLRCHEISQKYFFNQWKNEVLFQKEREERIKIALQHICRQSTQYAFHTWVKWSAKKMQHQNLQNINHEESSIYFLINKTKQNANYYDKAAQQQQQVQKTEKQMQIEYIQKQSNCLKTLIKTGDTNFHMKKERYILQQWHLYTSRRKRALSIFSKAMTKTCKHIVFDEVRKYSQKTHMKNMKQLGASKFLNLLFNSILKKAINKWKQSDFYCIKQLKQQSDIDQTKVQSYRKAFIKKINKRVISQKNQYNNQKILSNSFKNWIKEIKISKQLNDKIKSFQENHLFRSKQNSLLKWHFRSLKTKSLKNKHHKMFKRTKFFDLFTVFNAWKGYFYKTKNLLVKLNKLENKVDLIYLKESFDKIQNQVVFNSVVKNKNQTKSCIIMKKFVNQFIYKQLRMAFNKLRENELMQRKKNLTQKSLMKNLITHKVRNYFYQWKLESQRREVIKQNSEEGPIKVETQKLRQQFLNLKQAIIDDGFKKEEVEQIVKQYKEKDLNKMEKAICRLFCYNDDLYLLPKCLDQWKNYVHQRKLYKYWLSYLNRRVNVNTSDLAQAFNKWRTFGHERKAQLQKSPIRKLQSIVIVKGEKLEQLADVIEQQEQTVEQLTEQRNMLLKSYISSQRLALAVSNASYDKAKMKSYSKLLSNALNTKQSEFENGLKHNLDKIMMLKKRIQYLEQDNMQIAEQNEELRQGALDGIEMAKGAEVLTNEREKLSIDLADKAISIRKLLEDNNNLSIRLSHAQEEAQILIKVSQVKMQNAQGSVGVSSDYLAFNEY